MSFCLFYVSLRNAQASPASCADTAASHSLRKYIVWPDPVRLSGPKRNIKTLRYKYKKYMFKNIWIQSACLVDEKYIPRNIELITQVPNTKTWLYRVYSHICVYARFKIAPLVVNFYRYFFSPIIIISHTVPDQKLNISKKNGK